MSAWQGAASFRNRAPMRNLSTEEPTIILLDIDLLFRADPDEQGRDLMTAMAALFEAAP